MANEELVQPKVAATTPTETPAASVSIPDEVLQIPAMQALFAGQPAALSASIADFTKRPEGKLIQQHRDSLMKAGISLYRGLDGDTGVVFNQAYLSGPELQAADKAGQLSQVAPSFDAVNSEVAKSGANNPVLNAKAPAGFRTAPVPDAPQMSSAVPPASSGVQRQAMAARVQNLQPSGPISGPKPGSGRLLNVALTPVI